MSNLALGSFSKGLFEGINAWDRHTALMDERERAKQQAEDRKTELATETELKRQQLASQDRHTRALEGLQREQLRDNRVFKNEDIKLRGRALDQQGEQQRGALAAQNRQIGIHQQQVNQQGEAQRANAANDAERNRIAGEENASQAKLRDAQVAEHNAKAAAAQAETDIARREQERYEASTRLSAQMEAYKLDGKLADPQGFIDDISKTLHGMKPHQLLDGSIERSRQIFDAVRAGQLPPNSPEAAKAIQDMFPDFFERGIGEQVKVKDGGRVIAGRIIRKEPLGADIPQEGPAAGKMIFGVRVHVEKPDGTKDSYIAPVTANGTSKPDDPPLTIDLADFEHEAAYRARVEYAFRDPKRREVLQNAILEATKPRPKAGAKVDDPEKREVELENKRADTEAKRELARQRSSDADSNEALANRMRGGAKVTKGPMGEVTVEGGSSVPKAGAKSPAASAPAPSDKAKSIVDQMIGF